MRHPEDPEPVRDTKATATFWLGVLAVVTGLTIGGAVPATVALVLAGQARRDIADGRGWRRGGRLVTIGERLAWIGLGLAALALASALMIGLWRRWHAPEHDFPPSIN
jgi:hydroxylaminobenzene mutase